MFFSIILGFRFLILSSKWGYKLSFAFSFIFRYSLCRRSMQQRLKLPLLLYTTPKILLQVLSIRPQRALSSACLCRPVHKLLVLEQCCFSTSPIAFCSPFLMFALQMHYIALRDFASISFSFLNAYFCSRITWWNSISSRNSKLKSHISINSLIYLSPTFLEIQWKPCRIQVIIVILATSYIPYDTRIS